MLFDDPRNFAYSDNNTYSLRIKRKKNTIDIDVFEEKRGNMRKLLKYRNSRQTLPVQPIDLWS